MATKVNFAVAFQRPIHALHNGAPVRLIAIGDVEGMSPSYCFVDEQGNSAWASQREFRIVDLDALPTSAAALETAGSARR